MNGIVAETPPLLSTASHLSRQVPESCAFTADTVAACNTATLLHLRGKVDVLVLEQALSVLLHKHPVLRSVLEFQARSRSLRLRVKPFRPVFLQPENVDPSCLAEAAGLLAAGPFASEKPTYFFHLFRLASDHHVLLLCCHQALVDHWSTRVMLQSLAEAYNRLRIDPAWQASVIDTGFFDYCGQMRRAVDADRSVRLGWWKRHLRTTAAKANATHGVRNTGSIPQPQPRPFALSNRHLVLPPQVLAATRLVCSQQGVTLFSSMLTALKLALAECTGLSEQIVGLAVAGRDRAHYDNSVGCFENTVPTRDAVLTTGSPFLLRQQVHAHVQDALLHALPLQQLIAELQPAVLAGGNAWFDVLFTFQTLPPGEMRFDGLATRVESVQPLHGPYRLKVEVLPGAINDGAPWQIRLEYAHERFEQRDITKLAETLQRHIVSMAG